MEILSRRNRYYLVWETNWKSRIQEARRKLTNFKNPFSLGVKNRKPIWESLLHTSLWRNWCCLNLILWAVVKFILEGRFTSEENFQSVRYPGESFGFKCIPNQYEIFWIIPGSVSAPNSFIPIESEVSFQSESVPGPIKINPKEPDWIRSMN